MNKPDFSVRFYANRINLNRKSKYIIYMEDLNLGNMSLTNGMEPAIKKTVAVLSGRFDPDDLLNHSFIFYKDSEGEYARVLLVDGFAKFTDLNKARAERILELIEDEK